MKKKIIFVTVIVVLCSLIGVKAYYMVHQNAQAALLKVQSSLKQLAGPNGTYSFSDAHINLWTQSVIINNVKLSLAGGNNIQASKISVTIVGDKDISLFVAHDLLIQLPDYNIKTAYFEVKDLQGVLLNPLLVKEGISFDYLSQISFHQATLRMIFLENIWGKFHVGNLKIGYQGQRRELTWLFSNVDYSPKSWLSDKFIIDILHFNQLIVQSPNGMNKKRIFILPMFLKENYSFTAYDIKGLQSNFHELFSMQKLNMKLNHHQDVFDGDVKGDKIHFNLLQSSSLFSEYLKRIGYKNIDGFFQFDFSYIKKNSVFTFSDFFYRGSDFVGFILESQFILNLELLSFDLVSWQQAIQLKNLTLMLQDTGLKRHLFSALSVKTKTPLDKIQQETLMKFENYASGKDFELDRCFYHVLSNVIRNPKDWMKISVTFSIPEEVDGLLNMNFLDFFKLINQNNLMISTIHNHQR